jgi:hypothetical protein
MIMGSPYCPAPSGLLSANEEFVFEATVQDNITSFAGCLSSSTITKGSVTGSVDASAIIGVAQVQIYAPSAQERSASGSLFFSRPPLGSLSLRPGDSLTILIKMALSVGFIHFVSSGNATQAKGLLTSTPVGLPPTEHVCSYWTHLCAIIP